MYLLEKGLGMAKDSVFTMKLEPELRDAFMKTAAGEDRPASQIMRELMRDYVAQRPQKHEYESYLRRKVEAGRGSRRAGRGKSNEEVEAEFAARRSRVRTGRT